MSPPRLNLRQLDSLSAEGYLYLEDGDDTQLKTSANPLGKTRLFCIFRPSPKHAYLWNKLKVQVRRDYGVELRADNVRHDLIKVQSVRRQIADAQARNAEHYNQLIDSVRTTYTEKFGADFGERQAHDARQLFSDEITAGRRVRQTRWNQVRSQLELLGFAHELDQRYGAGAGDTFRAEVAHNPCSGRPLSRNLRAQWYLRFGADKAVAELRARIGDELGRAAGQAAADALRDRIAALTASSARPPFQLARYGQLPPAWVADAIGAAIRVGGTGNAAWDLPRKQALGSRQARIDRLERMIAGGVKDAVLSLHPTDVFQPDAHDDIYQTCEDLAAIDRCSTLARLGGVRDSSAHVGKRLTEARHIADLGLQLRQEGVPPAEAAYILHMEAFQRATGAGHRDPRCFSPLIGGSLFRRRLAQHAVSLESTVRPRLDKQAIGQLLELELVERRAGRGAEELRELSPKTRELLLNRDDRTSLLEHGVPLSLYGEYRARGAEDCAEVVHCYKLGMAPEYLRQDMTERTAEIFETWRKAGFSQAEAQAYAQHFEDPDEIGEFKGSLLKPEEILIFKKYGIPYFEATKLGRFIDANQIGKPKRLGSGFFNNVYLVRFRAPDEPNGYVERAFKRDSPKSGRVAQHDKNALRNCLASRLDRRLGFNVLAQTEMGITDRQLGISMSLAKGARADRQQTGIFEKEVVTPGSKYSALLRDRNLRGNKRRIKKLCKVYRLRSIKFNERGGIVVTPEVLAQNNRNPQLQRGLVKLQLVDALLGLRDRHERNYAVDVDPETGGVTVTGFDNDDAYNSWVTRPGGWFFPLPPVVDEQMYVAITSIGETDYRRSLHGLSKRETKAAISRLRRVQRHLRRLKAKGRVISSDDQVNGWGSRQVTARLMGGRTYLARDCRSKWGGDRSGSRQFGPWKRW